MIVNAEAKLRAIVDSVAAAVITVDEHARIVSFNRTAERMFGYEAAEVVRCELGLLMADSDRGTVLVLDLLIRRMRTQLSETDPGVAWEVTGQRKDGALLPLEIRTAPMRRARKRLFTFTIIDITSRKQAEESLHDRETRYRTIFDTAPVALWDLDISNIHTVFDRLTGQGITDIPAHLAAHPDVVLEMVGAVNIRDVNAAGVQLFDARDKDQFRTSFSQIFVPETVPVLQRGLTAIVDGKSLFRSKAVFQTLRGERIETLMTISFPPADAGFNSVLVSIMDITSLKEAEAELRLQAIALEAAASGIVITDHAGKIIRVNSAFTEITGYLPEEAVGQNTRILKSGQQAAGFYENMWKTITAGQIWRDELVNKRKDGTLYNEEMTIAPVRSAAGNITHFIAIKNDITEQRSLELQLQQAQKMESVGRLAGGVAHDFNNLLTIINGYGELLRMTLTDENAQQFVDEIVTAGRRAAALTAQLLAFSRKQVVQPRIVDLNQLITDSAKMLRRLIGEDIELFTNLTPELQPVFMDEGQINQVLMNLAVNARDAMPRGGSLTIETDMVELDEDYARLHVSVQPGVYVLLAISDTGHGMDKATKARIFEPFFTTKPVGEGTGLGLSTVYGIVRQAEGHIHVYSELSQGTTFKIYLPPTGEEVQPEQSGIRHEDLPSGTETLLLAEDEEEVRRMMVHILASKGYIVLEAEDGARALELSASYPDPIHLLITDVIMPKMSGRDLTLHLETVRPDMQVLYMSGYIGNVILNHDIIDAGFKFIQKPFTTAALLIKIRNILDQKHKPVKGA